jgi:polysaccharide biosynthesis protein PslH
MEQLLFLAHRLPYPPNKGDKIRSFNALRFLAKRYRVLLGTFIDDPADRAHVDTLRALCEDVCVVEIDPRLARLRSLTGLLRGEALTVAFYRSAVLRDWVRRQVETSNVKKAFVFSSAMAQYVEEFPQLHVVADYCDVDSAKWTEYATRKPWPVSLLFDREGRELLAFERHIALRVSACALATQAESDLFAKLAPECSERVHVVGNGVDTDFFSPEAARPSPFTAEEAPIVFTGAMDYYPNELAVEWFARSVVPAICARDSRARFYIVGMNPTPQVRALAQDPRVVVTGRVPDVRPYLQYARAVVAPIEVARGVQNKVLEAMAMARPVVVTPAVAKGITGRAGVDYELASGETEFTDKVLGLLAGSPDCSLGRHARERVLADFAWNRNLEIFAELLNPGRAPLARAG